MANSDDKPCARRLFFSALRNRMLFHGRALYDEMKGMPVMDLGELDSVSDDVIAPMVPVPVIAAWRTLVILPFMNISRGSSVEPS